jgi:hypothetical protein
MIQAYHQFLSKENIPKASTVYLIAYYLVVLFNNSVLTTGFMFPSLTRSINTYCNSKRLEPEAVGV